MVIELSVFKLNFFTQHKKGIAVQAYHHFPHIAVKSTHFMDGYKFPPFVIMKGVSESKFQEDLLQINDIFVAFHASGWMSEAIFAL